MIRDLDFYLRSRQNISSVLALNPKRATDYQIASTILQNYIAIDLLTKCPEDPTIKAYLSNAFLSARRLIGFLYKLRVL